MQYDNTNVRKVPCAYYFKYVVLFRPSSFIAGVKGMAMGCMGWDGG